MDLTGLDKDSKVAPMLVRLYDTHKLYDLAKDRKPLARNELSDAICEILGVVKTEREGELIADVLISLIRQAEHDLKAALSEKLSTIDDVPLRVVLNLANDDIDVAKPMLANSMLLGDLDLIYIIKSKDQDYWRAIAERESMSSHVVNVLAETRESGTVQRLLANNNIVLPNKALQVIAHMAEASEAIAKPLLHRPEVDEKLAAHLYTMVGQELQKFIVRNYSIDGKTMADALGEVVLEMQDVVASEFTPNPSMLKTAERQNEKGLLTIPSMIGTLRRGQMQSFIAQFAVYTKLSAKQIEMALAEPDGKMFTLICKAFDILKPDFVTMYLLTNRVRKKGQMVDMNDVSRVVSYYNRADAQKAREALNIK